MSQDPPADVSPEALTERDGALKVIRISTPASPDVAYVRHHQPGVYGVIMAYDGAIGGHFIDYFVTEDAAVKEAKALILSEMAQPPRKPVWHVTLLFG